MQLTEQIMGMPVTLNLPDAPEQTPLFEAVFGLFHRVDERFSPYKARSEVTQVGQIGYCDSPSNEMSDILRLAEDTKHATRGYFNVWNGLSFDPSGLVKGWAIDQAALLLRRRGITNYYLEAGGDIVVSRPDRQQAPWRIGIRNPFDRHTIIKTLELTNGGVATSGTAIRGQHIYNPHAPNQPLTDIVSLTVIAPTIYDADRFATAAFAMGTGGIHFIEQLPYLEGYQINHVGIATFTSGFDKYAATP